ncbi:hypothetical protein B0T10DRAFT_550047 [Thelonectria olida]|uniref:Uncharacterized protein n=1 Tax=Thelonectria olida TaxID=1576542 RepID=A0A9P8W2K5_9HYPO|nr:hypothetical protein B0T10DRAFT_550047 [Thelonectria olida]
MDPFNALRATYYLVLFGIDIAQVPSSVRHSLELVRTCYADVQHLIELRQTYLSLLEKRPPVLERVNTIITAATNGLVEVCAIVEKCRPEANKGRVPFRQRVEWIFFDEKEIRAQEPVISRHHASVLAELNFLRQIALFAPVGASDDKTSQKPEERKVFDNVALMGDLMGGASDSRFANIISTETPSMSTNPYPTATMPRAEPFIHPPPAYTAQPTSRSNGAPPPIPSSSQHGASHNPALTNTSPTKPMQSPAASTNHGSVVFSSHDAAGLSLMFGGGNDNISTAPSRAQQNMHRTHSDVPGTAPPIAATSSMRPQPPRSVTDQPYCQQNIHHARSAPPPSSHGMPHPSAALEASESGRPLHPGQCESQNNLNRPNMWQSFEGPNDYTQRHAMPASPRPSTQHIEAATPPNPRPQKKGWANWEHHLHKIHGVDPGNTRERDLQSHLDTCVNAGVSPLLKPQQPDWSHPSHIPGHLHPMPSTQTLRSELISPVSSVVTPAPTPHITMPDHPSSRPHTGLLPGHTSWNNPPGVAPGNVQLLSTIPPGMIYGQPSLNTTMSPPMQQAASRHDTSTSISTVSSIASVPPHTFQPQHMSGEGIQYGHRTIPGASPGAIPTAPSAPTMWELPGSPIEHPPKVDHTPHSHYHAPVVEQVHELSSVQFSPDPVELPAGTYGYHY